jgi:peptidyl-dipeptidase Dcp
MIESPFFETWTTPFGLPSFDRIRPEHFPPAFDRAMAEHDVEIAAITGSTAAPTFANTIEALERSGRLLDRVSRVFFNLDSSNTNDALEAIARDYAPKLAQHQTQTSLDENLFRRIAVLYERRDTLDLAPDQRRLLEHYQPEQKARMASIVERLAVLLFGQNVLHDERDWQLVLDEADLKQAKAFMDSTEADERGIRLRLP